MRSAILRRQIINGALIVASVFCPCLVMSGQTPAPSDGRGVIRIRVRLKIGEATRGLARKRFFLIRGSAAASKSLLDNIEQQTVLSRDCYYRSIGASEALISWLKENDCESVYCRDVETKDVEGPSAVPEFQHAVAAGEKEFQSRDLARKWTSVNLTEDLRSGFYRRQQTSLEALLKQATQVSQAPVLSVMTDRNGTAYFTDLEVGSYVLSNLLPTETGDTSQLWNCEINVKVGDIATERPFLISNRKDRTVKCVSIEKPLPACVR
jgi:hypothetical protein